MGGAHHHGLGFVDPLAIPDSPLRRLPAALKLVLTFTLMVIVLATPVTPRTVATVFPAALMTLVIGCGVGFVSPLFLLGRAIMVEFVVLLAAVMTLFQPRGIEIFLSIALRSGLCVGAVTLLTATTAFSELLTGLRRLHLPEIFITTLALTFRYLFLITEEFQRLRRARAGRTFTRGRRWTSAGESVGRLFLRTSDRAHRVHRAMSARGWR